MSRIEIDSVLPPEILVDKKSVKRSNVILLGENYVLGHYAGSGTLVACNVSLNNEIFFSSKKEKNETLFFSLFKLLFTVYF